MGAPRPEPEPEPATNKLAAGAADTPPLGWCSWQRYRCAISCNDSTSTDCFNERLIKDTADAMAASGLAKAGYEYVACALALQRAASQRFSVICRERSE